MDNPLSYYSHSMKALTFSKLKMNDSAFQYTGKLHRMMPYNHPFYDTYVKNLSYRKDSITILSTFKALDLKMVSASYFISTFNSLIVTGYDLKKSLAIVQRGQIIFPNDTMLSNFVLKAKKRINEHLIQLLTYHETFLMF